MPRTVVSKAHEPNHRVGRGLICTGGADVSDIEIPQSGLITADMAAQLAGVKVGTIRQWKNRGHLDVARDTDGREFKDANGRQLFDYMDVINTEYRLRGLARRRVVPYLSGAQESR